MAAATNGGGEEMVTPLAAPKLPTFEAADLMKWKGDVMHECVATLSPDGKTVECDLCSDGRSGGFIVMRHPYCLWNWTNHCKH